MRSDHKWSLTTRVEMNVNARCELTDTLVIRSPRTLAKPNVNKLTVFTSE